MSKQSFLVQMECSQPQTLKFLLR